MKNMIQNLNKKSIFLSIFSFFISFLIIIFLIFKSEFYIKKYRLPSEKNEINIAAITDKNYVNPLRVAIYSSIINKAKNSKYHFFIIGVELGKDDIEKLQKLKTENVNITILNNEKYFYKKFKIDSITKYVTKADFLKFSLANIFPEFKKILYIDCDLIIQKDLKELYDNDFEDNYAIVVEELSDQHWARDIGLKKYFNNGVMLLNLDKFRKDNIKIKLYLNRFFNKKNRFVTQDSFNMVLQPKVKFTDFKYNLLPINTEFDEGLRKKYQNKFNSTEEDFKKFFYDLYKINEKQYPTMKKYVENAYIIHFAGKNKPWKTKEALYSYIWQKYSEKLNKDDSFN